MVTIEVNKIIPAIEAIIFASGASVPVSRMAQVLEVDIKEVNNAVDILIDDYKRPEKGISLIRLGESVQMCSKPEYGKEIRDVMDLKRNTPLSQAAMEVLAVVAYNQPVTKAFIEQVRGVDCSGVVGSLCDKGLIEEKGRLELPGRPLIYGTTENFLRCFGISSPEELPVLPKEEQEQQEENAEINDDVQDAEATQ